MRWGGGKGAEVKPISNAKAIDVGEEFRSSRRVREPGS